MTGNITKMPDNFNEYFEKWLARELTQKEIAKELGVSQSSISNWIIMFREQTGRDRDIGKTPLFEYVLARYEQGGLTTRDAGCMLDISHTEFRNLVKAAREKRQQAPDVRDERPGSYGIDQMLGDLQDDRNTPETGRDDR